MKCKVCGEDKVKNPESRGSSNRFVDENARLWNGKACPDCYKIYNRERMRRKRAELRQLKDKDDQILDIQDT
jgi:hypothetical protein